MPESQALIDRAARVKLGGAVRVSLLLEGQHIVRARLHELSVSGGLFHLRHAIPEGTLLEMSFHLQSGIIRGSGEMRKSMWATRGCLQAFRFTHLDENDRETLETAVQALLGPEL
jgi:PilZ domain